MLTTADEIAIAAAVIAVVSLGISLYSASVTKRVATSGFQSAERVKSDTATLMAALRGLMVKGALYTQQDATRRDDPTDADYIDIKPEKAAIQAFICSSTAIAYHGFVASHSKAALDAGAESEEWRTFFLSLGELVTTSNQYQAAQRAGRIENRFDSITDRDLVTMADGMEDINGSIRTIFQNRRYDPLIAAIVERQPRDPTKE